MPTAALTIWIIALVVVAIVIVPVALNLLNRTLAASKAIERYLADMEASGKKIAQHTGAISALDETLATAVTMVGVANDIEAKTEAAKDVLSARAGAPN
jgi:hypothetical protein